MSTSTSKTAELPAHYDAPALIVFGELRQMIRGAGSPNSADFSSQDNDQSVDPNICLGSPASDGNQLSNDDCDTYFPF